MLKCKLGHTCDGRPAGADCMDFPHYPHKASAANLVWRGRGGKRDMWREKERERKRAREGMNMKEGGTVEEPGGVASPSPHVMEI